MGLILGISNAIMGLTIIAWGNSVGDSVSNVIVSRKGHPQMAIAACTAAPLTSKFESGNKFWNGQTILLCTFSLIVAFTYVVLLTILRKVLY
jgi:hypothetical protein